MASSTFIVALLCCLVAISAAAPARSPAKAVIGGIECSICNWAVGEVESLLKANQTEQAIIGLLLGDCSVFGPFQSTCQLFINSTVPQLINLLEQNYPPSQVCAMVGLCGSSNSNSGNSGNSANTGNSGNSGNSAANSGNNNAATNGRSASSATTGSGSSAAASSGKSASSGGSKSASSGSSKSSSHSGSSASSGTTNTKPYPRRR